MKKFLIIALSAVFVLGLAASAFAIHAEIPSETQAVVAKGETQVTLGGSIRVRGEVRDNTTDFNDNVNDSTAGYDQRVRLSLDAKVSDDVQGYIMLESTNSSHSPTADSYTWGSNSGASGVYGVGNAKPTDVQIVQAWINYKNDVVNLKVGHMPLALGNKLFFDHRKFGDDAIVLYKDIDNTHLAAIAIKLSEGLGTTTAILCGADVAPADGIADAGGAVTFPVAGACPAGTVAVAASTSAASKVLSDDADAYVVLFAHKGDGFNISGDVTWVNDNSFAGTPGTDADLFNIGLRGDTEVASVKLKADIEIQRGDTDSGIATGLCNVNNCDFGGYAVLLGASADLDSVTLGLEFGYGSGDDNAADSDFDLFVNSLSSGVPYISFVHGTRAGNVGGANGISNLTYLKGSISGSPAENMTAKADIIWLQSSEDILNYVGGVMTDDIGWEIDGKVTYKLAKNLVYWVEGGYLFAGDVYDISATASADAAYALRHGIELSF